MSIGDLTSLVVALATVGSLLYISRQVNVTRQQAKGQFLLALDELFDKSGSISLRMIRNPGFVPADTEWYQIYQLMGVFERINIMVEDGILDVGLVDRLYSYRLLGLINNDAVYQRLVASGTEWQDFIDLCYAIADYKNKPLGIANNNQVFIDRVHKLTKQPRGIKSPWGFS